MIEEKQLIDECFYVSEKRFGTWDSYDKEGKGLITSLTREHCINATRFYLKAQQEGWSENVKAHCGEVGGKL